MLKIPRINADLKSCVKTYAFRKDWFFVRLAFLYTFIFIDNKHLVFVSCVQTQEGEDNVPHQFSPSPFAWLPGIDRTHPSGLGAKHLYMLSYLVSPSSVFHGKLEIDIMFKNQYCSNIKDFLVLKVYYSLKIENGEGSIFIYYFKQKSWAHKPISLFHLCFLL